jgi:arginase family enzyme
MSASGFAVCIGAREGACFYRHARDEAASAHLLVVNHSLLLSNLQVGGSLLPDFDYLIVDEAHNLEAEATRQFGFRVSQATVETLVERLGGGVTILQFDAHTDLRDRHHDSPWNHACVMRRVLEHRPHDGAGRPNAANIVPVGIRALTREERDVIREHGIEVVFAHEMRRPGWVERALEALGENVYITFDVDFFDPSAMPATGTPEPGGGSWWDALDLLSRVFGERRVVGADIVELAPRRGEEASAFTAAKLAYKMIGFWSEYR